MKFPYDDQLVQPNLADVIRDMPEELTFSEVRKIGRQYDYPKVDGMKIVSFTEKYVRDQYDNGGDFSSCNVHQLGTAIFFQMRRMNHMGQYSTELPDHVVRKPDITALSTKRCLTVSN